MKEWQIINHRTPIIMVKPSIYVNSLRSVLLLFTMFCCDGKKYFVK